MWMTDGVFSFIVLNYLIGRKSNIYSIRKSSSSQSSDSLIGSWQVILCLWPLFYLFIKMKVLAPIVPSISNIVEFHEIKLVYCSNIISLIS